MSQNNTNILADSIANIPHLAAFDAMVAQRMNDIEIENLLVYVIDTVSASALPTLARQFDIEGFSGYYLATTDEQRRAIIKQAIELKRYMGTVWSIRQAMIAVGFQDATLVEGIDTGDPATDWARFTIETTIGDTISIDGVAETNLAKLIKQYKPVRSYLEGISYIIGINDVLEPLNDELNIIYESPTMDEDLGHVSRFYNGAFNYDGSEKYIESNDKFEINIINV